MAHKTLSGLLSADAYLDTLRPSFASAEGRYQVSCDMAMGKDSSVSIYICAACMALPVGFARDECPHCRAGQLALDQPQPQGATMKVWELTVIDKFEDEVLDTVQICAPSKEIAFVKLAGYVAQDQREDADGKTVSLANTDQIFVLCREIGSYTTE